MKHLFVSIPSARGIHPLTCWNVVNMGPALETGGWKRHGASVYRMPLGLARNELACVFLSTTCEVNYLLDDDVQVEPGHVLAMLAAISAGADIVSAPCLLRDHSHSGAQDGGIFNIIPLGTPEVVTGGVRLIECSQTGLGAVMVRRAVLEKLSSQGDTYQSRMLPERLAADIFTERVVPASELQEGAPPNLGVYILDDIVFSKKARKAGFRIWAAVDVPTVHDGMRGCFSEAVERLDRERLSREKMVKGPNLIGPDGKPAR